MGASDPQNGTPSEVKWPDRHGERVLEERRLTEAQQREAEASLAAERLAAAVDSIEARLVEPNLADRVRALEPKHVGEERPSPSGWYYDGFTEAIDAVLALLEPKP